MTYEKSCGAVVFDFHNDCPFILVEHMVKGYVSLPKGPAEEGKTEEESIARVIREEANLEVHLDGAFRREVSYITKSGIHKTVAFFLAEAENVG